MPTGACRRGVRRIIDLAGDDPWAVAGHQGRNDLRNPVRAPTMTGPTDRAIVARAHLAAGTRRLTSPNQFKTTFTCACPDSAGSSLIMRRRVPSGEMSWAPSLS